MTLCREITTCAGKILLAAEETGKSLTGLWFERQRHFADTLTGERIFRDDLPLFQEVEMWLGDYFAGKAPDPSQIPVAPAGSPFRRLIWRLLQTIPYGEITTYGALAEQAARSMGKSRMSAQAVGGAVGANPIALLIPCHRVIGANGSLTGYAAGVSLKKKLLQMEAQKCAFPGTGSSR